MYGLSVIASVPPSAKSVTYNELKLSEILDKKVVLFLRTSKIINKMGLCILSRTLLFGLIFEIFRICIVVACGATGKYKVVVSARETSLTFQD